MSQKIIIFSTAFFFLLFVNNILLSQNITISPNHSFNTDAACPAVTYNYTVTVDPSGCDVEITHVGGNAITFTPNNTNKTFSASWSDIPQGVKVKVKPKASDPDCAQVPETDFDIPILSVNGLTPTINTSVGCPGAVVIGKSVSFNMTAELLYPFKGLNDPSEVGSYEWAIDNGGQGWSMSFTSPGGINNKVAQVVTDISHGATIRVRGQSKCGRWSSWAYCSINRFVQPPCPIIGAPNYVVCGNTTAIGLLATTDPTLTGYTYSWTFPSGWSGGMTGPATSVTPNGTSGGTVSLVATAFGQTSSSCTKSIAFEPIEPATKVVGGDFLCSTSSATYKLDIPAPQGSQTTWAVVPANATSPSSGTGEEAMIGAAIGYQGNATITFTINTPCGTVTRQKTFFAGKPIITNIKIDGDPGPFAYICPNEGLGSHWITVTLQGDADNCVDEWNDYNTTATNHSTCNEFDFTLQYNPNANPPYNCVWVNVIASNECGVSSQNILACPSYWACDEYEYEFLISPNPASSQVNVQLYLDKNGEQEQMDFTFLDLIDFQGNLINHFEVSNMSINFDASNLQEGQYYVRTWIDEGYVMGQLLIER